MRGRSILILAGVALLAAACAPGDVQVSSPPAVDLGFIPQVVDVEGDAGAGVSVAVDGEGNPHYAYLAFEKPPAPGELPPPMDLLAPELPAVKHAHLVGDIWTRTVVTEGAGVGPEDETAIAVDAEGVHHVAWTQGGEVLYANDAGGGFSEPATVTASLPGAAAALGISMAVAGDGTPWIASYRDLEGPEGPATLIRVATLQGGEWVEQTAAEAGDAEPRTTGIALLGDQVLVAYGDGGRTYLARSGAVWRSEVADESGGLGVSMALDGEGNALLAYYNAAGEVRSAVSTDGGWQASAVADAGAVPEPGWSTSIALGQGGVHSIAWQAPEDVGFATNAAGSFQLQEVRGSAGGGRPRLAAGAEALFLAWSDSEDQALVVATLSEEEPLLAAPPGGVEPPPPPPPPGDGGAEGDVVVGLRSFAISTDPTSVGAGETTFAVTAEDSFHNFFVLRTDDPEDGLAVAEGIVDLGQYDVAAQIPDGFTPEAGAQTVSADLAAGRYVLICNVPGHYIGGMHTEFTVG